MYDANLDTESQVLISDCGASSSAIFYKDDFMPGACRALNGATMSGIESSLEAAVIGSICYRIQDDKGIPIETQTDKVLRLKQLPQHLISPQKIMQQHYSSGDGFFLHNTHATLKLGSHKKLLHAIIGKNYQFSLPLL